MISHFKLRAKREAQGISKHKSSEVAQVKLKCDHLMHHHRVEYAMFHASRQVCRFLSFSLEQLFNFFSKSFHGLIFYISKATKLLQQAKNDEASRAALKELIQSGQKIGLLRLALEKMLSKYPQWADEIKDEIHQDKPTVPRSMLQKPNAIVGHLEVIKMTHSAHIFVKTSLFSLNLLSVNQTSRLYFLYSRQGQNKRPFSFFFV